MGLKNYFFNKIEQLESSLEREGTDRVERHFYDLKMIDGTVMYWSRLYRL